MSFNADTAGGPRDGLGCYYGEPEWTNARFTLVDVMDNLGGTGALVIARQQNGSVETRRVDFEDITGLDELTDGMDSESLAGYQRLELSVNRSIYCQIIWPQASTERLLASLTHSNRQSQTV